MVSAGTKHVTGDALSALSDLLPADSRVVASPGCGSPTTLLEVLAQRSHQVPLTLMSGLQIDGYPFIEHVDTSTFRYLTWHVAGPLRRRLDTGMIDYVPARASEVPRLIRGWKADVTLIRVSPADEHGFHSLGPSASYPRPSAHFTPVVIAEIDPEVPRTNGATIHESLITATVDSQSPMPVYEAGIPDDTSKAIARHVCTLLPERPTLQLGIGAIPEAVTAELADIDLGPLRFAGMVTDSIVAVAEAGRLDADADHPDACISVAELMGGPSLMRFADENPLVTVTDSTISHNPHVLGHIPRFVSINSAVAIDLTGQINAETVNGRQISGIGGSVDYSEAAFASDGGLRIIAMASTTRDGRHSRIVESFAPGDAVTVPRSTADLVVTEHGVADLRGRSLGERREALLSICDPAFSPTESADHPDDHPDDQQENHA